MAEDKLLNVEIVTPQNVVYSGSVQSVTLPGSFAPFQVLYNHAPIVSALDAGIVKISTPDEKIMFFATTSGFAEVHDNKVSVLVESADEAGTINVQDEMKELETARATLANTENEKETEALKARIALAEVRIKAAEKINT